MRGTKYYKRLIVGSVLFGMIVFGNEVYNNWLMEFIGIVMGCLWCNRIWCVVSHTVFMFY